MKKVFLKSDCYFIRVQETEQKSILLILMLFRAYYYLINIPSMADAKFILYIRKFLKNPLMARKQVVSAPQLRISMRS